MQKEHFDLAACVAADAVEVVYKAMEEGEMSDSMADLEVLVWRAAHAAAVDEIDLSTKGSEH